MKRMTAVVLSILLLNIFVFGANAEEHIKAEREKEDLSGNKVVDISETVVLNGSYLIPFRSVFEELGAKIEWEAETERIILSIQGEQYVCEMKVPDNSFSDNKYFYVKNIKFGDSKLLKDHIQLNPMGAGGGYKMIDDRIYLYTDTMRRLLNYFGYDLEIKTEVTINRKR